MRRVSYGVVGFTLLMLTACSEEAVPTVESAFSQSPAAVFINELHYDNVGTDIGEAVEIAGPAGTDLTGWSIVLYNGNPTQRTPYSTRPLSGTLTNQQGGYGTVSLDYPSNGIQNGNTSGTEPDGIALVNTVGDVVQFLSYEGTFTAANGPASGLTSTDIGVSETGGEAAGLSLQLKGSGTTYQDFTWSAPSADSFGAVNAGQTFGEGGDDGGDGGEPTPPSVCGNDATLISAVQGEGATSPIVGQNVTVEAVVVGDFQGDAGAFSNLSGFYIQEEDADQDGNPNTSEGLFVFQGSATTPTVSEGDLVRVTGTVSEFPSNNPTSLTQLTSPTITVCGEGELPTPVDLTLPLASPDALERFEGMLVRLPQELVISEYFNFDRFGEITLALPQTDLGEKVDRLYTPTSYVAPGDAANREAAENALRRITLDDGRGVQNPDPARHPNGEPFTLQNRFRGGDTVQNVVGVVDERFGLYRIQPTRDATYNPTNPRPQAPKAVGGSLEVASFNVLNYFTTLESRGARTAEEFERQAAKIVAALAVIDADVVGLIEIQNNGEVAVGDLVNRLNAVVGAGTYAFIDTGVIGTDQITNALIYKPSTVTPVGNFALLDSSKDSRFLDTKNRPVLIQTFDETATGGRFTVAVNHFKSKGSDCNDVGDPDRNDGQANCNLTRTQAAAALADFLATDPTASGDPDFLIIGDLNAYDEEDPIRALETAGYTDLLEKFRGEFAYTYVFDGQFGYLDYALANDTLLGQVTGTTAWAINADEPDLFDYTTGFKQPAQQALFEPNAFRSSDHDPVIVGLSLTVPVTEPELTPEEALEALQDQVQALSGTLNRGQLRALQTDLDSAERHLGRAQTAQVVRSLERFEAGVRRLVRQGALSEVQGQPLLDASSAIRAQL